ncbi:MAG: hypothetical protein IH612_10305 [Desulfofustis sp.]|nr:hypothetical protein [Desulfofustis sp.]
MKKVGVFFVVALVFLVLLPGCVGSDNKQALIINLPTPDGGKTPVPIVLDRHGSYAVTRLAEETTKQEVLRTKQKETDLEIAQAEQVRITIDTDDELKTWALTESNRTLGTVAKALSKGGDANDYGVPLTTTVAPKSWFAEALDSAAGAVIGVADTPAAIAGTAGYFVSAAARGIAKGNGDRFYGGDGSTITKTETTNTATASQEGIANAGSGGTPGKEAAKGEDNAVSLDAAFDECSGGGGYEFTLGQVGTCMQEKTGIDMVITGGLLHVDGIPYAPVNDWEAARP